MRPISEIACEFRSWIDNVNRMESPLYRVLATHIADDPELLEIAAAARPGQPLVWVFLNAVQFHLMTVPGHSLAEYYACLSPRPKPSGDAYLVFRDFCLEHAAALKRTLSERRVQFTLVERVVGAMLAFSHVYESAHQPFHLIELGPSLGLALMCDAFAYEIASKRIGSADAVMTLTPRFIGEPPRAVRMPQFASRVGIDLAPVDVNDADTMRWVRCSHPPEWLEARRRLETAIAVRRRIELEIKPGDALAELLRLAARTTGPLCVLESHVLYQWSAEARRLLDQQLSELGRSRTVYFVSIGGQWMMDDERAAFDTRMIGDYRGAFITLTTYADGERTRSLLGQELDLLSRSLVWYAREEDGDSRSAVMRADRPLAAVP